MVLGFAELLDTRRLAALRHCPLGVGGSTLREVDGISSGWFALAGALGGVVVTGGISLFSAVLAHRWSEQAQDRGQREQEARNAREQRREAAHRYLVATNQYYRALDDARDRLRQGDTVNPRQLARPEFTAMQDAYVYLSISNGSEVRRLAHEYNLALYELAKLADWSDDEWNAADSTVYDRRNELRAAVRSELGIQD